MRNLGNLNNFNLGMGLVVKPGQIIPTKKSFFEGLSQATTTSSSWIWVVGLILILLLFLK